LHWKVLPIKDLRTHERFPESMSLRRLIPILAAIAACSASVHAAPIPPLSTLHAIHILSNDEANQGLPVAFEATVS
jgi:hypothetical protein